MSEYKTIQDLNPCLQESQQQPVLIFKHSTICPRSTRAKEEMDRFIKKEDIPVYLLIVQQERPLSNQIAETFSVKHESPQVLLLHNGQVESTLNHEEITCENVQQSLDQTRV